MNTMTHSQNKDIPTYIGNIFTSIITLIFLLINYLIINGSGYISFIILGFIYWISQHFQINLHYGFTGNKDFISVLTSMYATTLAFLGVVWSIAISMKEKFLEGLSKDVKKRQSIYSDFRRFVRYAFCFGLVALVLNLVTYPLESCPWFNGDFWYWLFVLVNIFALMNFLRFAWFFFWLEVLEDGTDKLKDGTKEGNHI